MREKEERGHKKLLNHNRFIIYLVLVTTLPYLFYKVLWWRPPFIHGTNPIYSAVLFHFISGILYALYYAVSSILVFILCLDRCLVLTTSHWDTKMRQAFLITGIFIVVIIYICVGASYTFEFPLNYDIREYFKYV